jgi:hypothetical protein
MWAEEIVSALARPVFIRRGRIGKGKRQRCPMFRGT